MMNQESEREDDVRWARRIAAWLPRLGDPETVETAAGALFEISMTLAGDDEDRESAAAEPHEERLRALALTTLDDQPRVVADWVDRYIEALARGEAWQRRMSEAISKGSDVPEVSMANIFTKGELERALGAAGQFLDPHVDRLVAALQATHEIGPDEDRTARRDTANSICGVLASGGPAIVRAVPALLNELHVRGIWSWPSNLTNALARAASVDPSVIGHLRAIQDDPNSQRRGDAINVLRKIGAAGRGEQEELRMFREGGDEERYGAIYALGSLGNATPAALDAIEAAFSDGSVQVRFSALRVVGDLLPDPARFVPLVIRACDEAEYVHDYNPPQTAVEVLGKYGPAAVAAMPRLRALLEGPIHARTVEPDAVREAIAQITRRPAVEVLEPVSEPTSRLEPVNDGESLFAVSYGGKLAYIDRRGEIVIGPRYDYGYTKDEFGPDGRAIVQIGQRELVIDRRGKVVFESKWDDIKPFREGFAAVERKERWGFVDVNGRVVVEPQYDSVTAFHEGLAGVELGRVPRDLGGGLSTRGQGKQGFIDTTGSVVIPIEIEHGTSAFHDGRAAIVIAGEMKPSAWDESTQTFHPKKHGFIDRTGAIVARVEGFPLVGAFSEGRADVTREPRPWQLRTGYIDVDGKVVIPAEFTAYSSFSEGVAIVRRPGRAHRKHALLIDRDGSELTRFGFTDVTLLTRDRFAARWQNGLLGMIDVEGRVVLEPQFDQIGPFVGGLAQATHGKWFALIDRDGNFVWGPRDEGMISNIFESDWT